MVVIDLKVIKINAIWCSGCLVMNKVWKNILKDKDIETIDLDYDMDEAEVKKYNPGNILPVFIFYQQEKEVYRVVGEKKEKDMREIIEKLEIENEKSS